jgi:aryl-alcohol dehydrogenase-like predicted oxidoreductase
VTRTAGRVVALVRHSAKTRRTGAGSTGTNRTEDGAGSRPSRGMRAAPRPSATRASWVECSDAVWAMRGWAPAARRVRTSQQAELSLRRSRLECIDLYQLHRVDPAVPLADQVGALRRLQDDGKVRHVGLSAVSVDQIREAEKVTPIASVQNRYSVTDRAHEDVLEYCEQRGIAFIAYLPVARTVRATGQDRVSAVARRLARPGRPGLVAAPLAGPAADPGHVLPDAS